MNKNDKVESMCKLLVGRVVKEVRVPTDYQDHAQSITIAFEDGTELEVRSDSFGCEVCDPDGMGGTIDVNYSEK